MRFTGRYKSNSKLTATAPLTEAWKLHGAQSKEHKVTHFHSCLIGNLNDAIFVLLLQITDATLLCTYVANSATRSRSQSIQSAPRTDSFICNNAHYSNFCIHTRRHYEQCTDLPPPPPTHTQTQ